jgi:hypothetical protein
MQISLCLSDPVRQRSQNQFPAGVSSLGQELLKWAWAVHERVTGEVPPFSLELPAEGDTAVAVPAPPAKRQRKN